MQQKLERMEILLMVTDEVPLEFWKIIRLVSEVLQLPQMLVSNVPWEQLLMQLKLLEYLTVEMELNMLQKNEKMEIQQMEMVVIVHELLNQIGFVLVEILLSMILAQNDLLAFIQMPLKKIA